MQASKVANFTFTADYDSPRILVMKEGWKGGRRVAKTSSILLKFEYVVVWGMGITE